MTQDTKALEERYLADFVMTATPVQRLLMLFTYLKSDLTSAEEAFEAKDNKKINDSLVHAQQILIALRDVLDPDTEFGEGLRAIYTFCIERLIAANINKDRSLISAVCVMVERIATANENAAVDLAKGGAYASR